MSFKNYNVEISYKSVGDETISKIINSLLHDTILYQRSVGFFSASALNFLSDGIQELIKNNGKIQLITSPKLSQEDIDAINLGYETKENIVYNRFSFEFRESLTALNDNNLKYLAELIAYNILDIKIVNKKDFGMYHDKVAILTDKCGDKFVFAGSNNETASGYGINYEKVRVYTSWDDEKRVADEEKDFNTIWNNEDEYLDTFSFKDAVKKEILDVVKERMNNNDKNRPKYVLYDYQQEAIQAWVNNNYKGFYVMATGTGKTVTSIYALKELMEYKKVLSVIVVPYKHLVTQWAEDIQDIFGTSVKIVKVSSENPGWDKTIKDYILINSIRPSGYKPIVIISTLASFYDDRFNESIKMNTEDRVLIVDEAHNFLNKILDKKYDIDYEYKLGLSATPVFGTDSTKTDTLVNFFGGIVYELPIEKAIGRFLVNYYYYPLFVNASEEDERKFKYQRKIMMGCLNKQGEIIDLDKYVRAHRAKLRAISMAEEKLNKISEFIDVVDEKNHFIIYCSDGRLIKDDKKHLLEVVDKLNEKGYKPSQFTCEENIKQRESLINNFNKGYISTLVAIRCLDEGINIPSIKSALVLSSNDNYREFVQRRGRILRKYPGKEFANIIDVIVLPSIENKAIAEIEFRRYYEYAKLALNKDQLLKDLNRYMDVYGLNSDDISFKNSYVDDVETE